MDSATARPARPYRVIFNGNKPRPYRTLNEAMESIERLQIAGFTSHLYEWVEGEGYLRLASIPGKAVA